VDKAWEGDGVWVAQALGGAALQRCDLSLEIRNFRASAPEGELPTAISQEDRVWVAQRFSAAI